jgi:hypothetical protein
MSGRRKFHVARPVHKAGNKQDFEFELPLILWRRNTEPSTVNLFGSICFLSNGFFSAELSL